MVAVKAHQAQSFLKSPDPKLQAVLFYGSDAGLVAERAQAFQHASAERFDPKGELIRLDDTDLEQDPDRLAVELGTVAMFGGPKVLRVAASRKINAAHLKPLVEGTIEGVLIVEAGNLRPDEALRKLFEKSQVAAAVACFSDGARDLEGLIGEVLGGAQLSISPAVRDVLVSRLGADRALSRGELEKLALFAHGKGEIEASDVDAVVGDVSELALERVYNAAALGRTGSALSEWDRAQAAGESGQAIVIATQRHFMRLHRVRAAIDRGQSFDDAAKQIRPPLHFRQKDIFAEQCRLWTLPRLEAAMGRISVAAKSTRTVGRIEDTLVARMLLGLAELARQGGRAGRR